MAGAVNALVVGRCADPERHVLYKAVRTPRGVEVLIVSDLAPRVRARLAEAARAFLARARHTPSEPTPDRPRSATRWVTIPWEEFATQAGPLMATCRCQAYIELDPRQVAEDVRAALAAGTTRTVRVPFA